MCLPSRCPQNSASLLIFDQFDVQSFTHALFWLAGHPEWAAILREEVKHVIGLEGWSKASISKLWKLDSFLKESQRIDGIDMGE